MSNRFLETLSESPTRARLSRRDLLGFAAKGAATSDKAGLTLQTSKTADGYAGVINLGVNVG